jgi:hypothetical protein
MMPKEGSFITIFLLKVGIAPGSDTWADKKK